MRLRFKNDKQKGFAPLFAFGAAAAALLGLVQILLIIALLFWIHHLVAGLIGGGAQPGGFYGSGNCATTQTFNGTNIPGGGKGKLVQEQHLATASENFPGGWPSGSHDQDERHYQLTNFSVNCAGCPKEGFTSSEGDPPGAVGQGTGEKPPANAEPWIINMRATFPRGTKMIVTSTKTGRTVVAAGGYEYGPSSHEFIGGAQPEVLNALGILNGDRTVTIGFAQDQNQPYGPVVCGGGTNIVGNGQCAFPVAHYGGLGYRYKDPTWYGVPHRGVDFSVPTGTPIYATMDGLIIESSDTCRDGVLGKICNGGFGNFIRIRHNNGVYSEYHHLSHGTMLTQGTFVKKGQQIALSDNNGMSRGAHLHFQMMNASNHNDVIDPVPCLGGLPESM